MLSKSQIKYINSLQIKKYRQLHQAFIVEGAKSVLELLDTDFEIELIAATPAFLQEHETTLNRSDTLFVGTSPAELEKLGTFQTNDSCLAVAKTKENKYLSVEEGEFALMLDDIRDPGNLGTIIRIADWYGIRKIICSESTTDYYNPKVIAASKGSFARISAYYTDLKQFVAASTPPPLLIGTFMEGEPVYTYSYPEKGGYLVLGNESNGISSEISGLLAGRITIPRIGQAESLNVAIAGAIVLDNLRRYQHNR